MNQYSEYIKKKYSIILKYYYPDLFLLVCTNHTDN